MIHELVGVRNKNPQAFGPRVNTVPTGNPIRWSAVRNRLMLAADGRSLQADLVGFRWLFRSRADWKPKSWCFGTN